MGIRSPTETMRQARNDAVPARGCRYNYNCWVHSPADCLSCGDVATIPRLAELGARNSKDPGCSAPGDMIRSCLKSFTDQTNDQTRRARFGNVLGRAQRFQRRLCRHGFCFRMHQN
jgi:hypothetical protein